MVLVGLARSVHTQNGTEGAVLKPADEKLAIGGIVGISGDESANVGGPVRNSGEREIQAGGNLPPETEEIGVDVARPGGDPITLVPSEGRTGENENTLFSDALRCPS